MTFTFWIGTILAILYGIATSISGFLQIKAKEIAKWSAIFMAILGVLVCTSSILILINIKIICLLISCFILIHIIAIMNGFYLYGRINITHHIIRLLITILILYLILQDYFFS